MQASNVEQAPPKEATQCPQNVLDAIYGTKKPEQKAEAYEESLKRWWNEYADRKNHEEEEEEHVANSLLYDKTHLPRMAPAPEWAKK